MVMIFLGFIFGIKTWIEYDSTGSVNLLKIFLPAKDFTAMSLCYQIHAHNKFPNHEAHLLTWRCSDFEGELAAGVEHSFDFLQ